MSLYIPCSSLSFPTHTLCILHFTLHHCTYPVAPPLSHLLLCAYFTFLYVTMHTIWLPSTPPTLCMLHFTVTQWIYPLAPPPFPTSYFVHTSFSSTSLYIPYSTPIYPTTYFVYTSLYSTSLYIPCSSPSPPLNLCILYFTLCHYTYHVAPPPPHHLCCACFTLLYVTVHTL